MSRILTPDEDYEVHHSIAPDGKVWKAVEPFVIPAGRVALLAVRDDGAPVVAIYQQDGQGIESLHEFTREEE